MDLRKESTAATEGVRMEGTHRTGLVLEGGAMRGLFTSGILDVFMENHICFDGAVGVSAGACFGCNYKSGQIGRAIRYNLKYCSDKRYGSYRSLFRSGDLFDADFCYKKLPLELDVFDSAAFRENPMEFYTVSTDVESGEAVYHKCEKGTEEDFEWIRSSASLPLFSRVVSIGKQKMLDGGIADSIPIRFFEEKGYTKNVVILTRPYDYQKQKFNMMPFVKLFLRKYPKLVQAIRDRHIMYNETTEYIKKQEKKGNLYVIRPSKPLHIKYTEKRPEELKRVYEEGRRTGVRYLAEVKKFLSGDT